MRVLLHSIVEHLDLLLIEEAEDALFQLAAALARNDLNETGLLFDGLVDDCGSARSMSSPRL
jgi:hypothetical protein